jgi:hypothetical protein
MLAHGKVPVMTRILRHISWRSTQKYVHTIKFKGDTTRKPSLLQSRKFEHWAKLDGADIMNSPSMEYKCVAIGSLNASKVSKKRSG